MNFIFRNTLVFIAAIVTPLLASAQPAASWSSSEIYQALKKLNTVGSVLYIAAHPDDENTRLIAYLSKEKLYRTGYLSLTRGDGGQNLIGDEQRIELGLIRTQEILAARRIDGGEQFFTRAYDFGYSKNPEETFSIWEKEKILSDVVWVIRKFQPDIIITRFPSTGEGNHGHHTASAILANEAFDLAADPNRFPEQLKYVSTWQAKRVLWNGFNFNNPGADLSNQFKLDVGSYNALLGKSPGEIAAESRSQHKSQGFGSAARRGESFEYFATTNGSAPLNDIMDGCHTGWSRIKNGNVIEQKINKLIASYSIEKPEQSVAALADLYKAIAALEDNVWKTQKLGEVKNLIAQCSGIFIEAIAAEQYAVQTDSARITVSLNNRLGAKARLHTITVDEWRIAANDNLPKNKNIEFSNTFFVPVGKALTQPYWLAYPMDAGAFKVTDQRKIGQPDADPAFVADIELSIENLLLHFTVPVKYKYTDPVKGELYQPVYIIPPVTLSVSPSLLVFKKNETDEKKFSVSINANKKINQPVYLSLDKKSELISIKDSTGFPKFQSHTHFIPVSNHKMKQEKEDMLPIADFGDGAAFYNTLRSIHYEHIPDIKYIYTNPVTVLNIDLETVHKKIGYIIGAGDKVPLALQQMGYEVMPLAEKDITTADLQQFDAIITGIRAYNTNDWLNGSYDKLMKYVFNGGNLIVQYNTNSNAGPLRDTKMGPYPFSLSRNRITDENARVDFVNPTHQVLHFPNEITAKDFEGWSQERSIYHATNWDKEKYETVLSMKDPGEKPDEGSLIIAKHGNGYFTYTGLVFFRELPAGVPGAYRLLANLIALNVKKAM